MSVKGHSASAGAYLNWCVCVARELYPMLKSLAAEKQLTQLVYSALPLCHLGFSVSECVLSERELCLFRSEFKV